jgi:hypothetical protein
MSARCPVCTIRVGPCLDEHGAPMGQYHDARVRAEAKGRIDHAAEALRLRQEQRKAAIRERVAVRSKP